jgi:hypothetical protein
VTGADRDARGRPASESSALTGVRSLAYDGTEIVAWLETVRPLLRASRWAPGLEFQGVDVIDVLRSYIYMALARVARAGGSPAPVADGRRRSLREWARVLRGGLARRFMERTAGQASAKPEPCSVVFWPWQLTHVKAQAPVAATMPAMGLEHTFVVSRPEIFKDVRERAGRAVFSTVAWRRRVLEGRKEGARLGRIFAVDPGVSFPPFPAPGERSQLVAAIRDPVIELIAMVGEMVAVTDAIVESTSPRVLVVGNDLTLVGRTGCLRSRTMGVRTVCLIHGSIAGDPLQGAQLADKILVYGDTNLRQLIDLGVDAARIEVCGAPYLDDLPRQSGEVHPALRRHLGLAGGRPFVLVASSGPGYTVSHAHHDAVIRAVMRLSAALPAVDFVAKLHRKDRPEHYARAKQAIPTSRLRVVPDGTRGLPANIFEWLQGCSLLLTGASTVALESMLMGVPVVTMDMADELRAIAFIDAGATLHVKNEAELESTVAGLLRSPEMTAAVRARASEYLTRNYYALDGASGRRAAGVIRELCAANGAGE